MGQYGNKMLGLFFSPSKESHKQSKQTVHRMGKESFFASFRQGANSQNLQRISEIKYQENKNTNQ